MRALSFYILRTLTRHRRTSMFFCDLGAMGRCRVLCPLCFWASELVAALLDLGSSGAVFVPPGWILCPLGLHFESFESLWCEPEAPGARHREKFEKISKMKRLGSLIGSFLGHILSPLPPKIEPTSVLLRWFVSLFSRAFLAVFRSGFLDEIVESRRRPVCVWDNRNWCFHKIRLFGAKPPEIDFMMILSSILEAFWKPSWLSYSLLVTAQARADRCSCGVMEISGNQPQTTSSRRAKPM